MFPKTARLKAASPAARRKAVATMKRNRALKLKKARQETAVVDRAKGKVTMFKLSDLPSTPPPAKKKYTRKTPVAHPPLSTDRVQLARELIAAITQILK